MNNISLIGGETGGVGGSGVGGGMDAVRRAGGAGAGGVIPGGPAGSHGGAIGGGGVGGAGTPGGNVVAAMMSSPSNNENRFGRSRHHHNGFLFQSKIIIEEQIYTSLHTLQPNKYSFISYGSLKGSMLQLTNFFVDFKTKQDCPPFQAGSCRIKFKLDRKARFARVCAAHVWSIPSFLMVV